MTNAFSALSLKRNRSPSTSSKKESKLNAIINKITSTFYTPTTNNSNKKRRQHNRRSSLSTLIDYFRTDDNESIQQQENNHPFANDALFEHNRYKQQKQQQKQTIQHKPSSLYDANLHTTTGILLKSHPMHEKKSTTMHRYTNSSPSAIIGTSRRKNKSNHIRHYSHVSCISSSNITVNSEFLTAKEFADIAGIRILSEDEDVDMSTLTYDRQRKICTFCGDDDNDIMVPSLIVTSSRHPSSIVQDNASSIISDVEEEPHIWDDHFWERPGSVQPQPMCEPPPILHEIKRNSAEGTSFIKKGRFEIHLSINNSLPVKKHDVLEWKRKRLTTTTLKHQATA